MAIGCTAGGSVVVLYTVFVETDWAGGCLENRAWFSVGFYRVFSHDGFFPLLFPWCMDVGQHPPKSGCFFCPQLLCVLNFEFCRT